MDNIKVQSTVETVDKPSIDDWMNEFKVSSRYQIQHHSLNENQPFDMKLFKKNLDKGLKNPYLNTKLQPWK